MESSLQGNNLGYKYSRVISPYTLVHKSGKNLDKLQSKKENRLSINTNNLLVKEIQSLDLNASKQDRNSWITKDETTSELKLEIVFNNGVIKELESWTNLLLNLINQSRLINSQSGETHYDSATPINAMLDKISKIEVENLNLQLKLIAQSRKTKLSEKQVQEVKSKLVLMESDLAESNERLIKTEMKALLESVVSITEELDIVSASNMNFKLIIENEGNQIISLIRELEEEKQTNKDLNCILLSPCALPLDAQLLEHKAKNKKKHALNLKLQRVNAEKYDSSILSCVNGTGSAFEREHTLYNYK